MGFQFIMSLRKFHSTRDVIEIIFDISRYGRHTKSLTVDKCSDFEAVEIVEDYMSQPMTLEYYESIKDDLFFGFQFDEFKVRGDALGDCKFLEKIKSSECEGGRKIVLICGS